MPIDDCREWGTEWWELASMFYLCLQDLVPEGLAAMPAVEGSQNMGNGFWALGVRAVGQLFNSFLFVNLVV